MAHRRRSLSLPPGRPRAAGEISRARALARTAAADAEAAFAFHRAVDLYSLALETGGLADAERRALARRHAECLVNTGRLAEAIEVLVAAAGAEGAERRELKRLEIECRLRCGDYVHGLAETRALLGELGVHIPAGSAAIIAATITQQVPCGCAGSASPGAPPPSCRPRCSSGSTRCGR